MEVGEESFADIYTVTMSSSIGRRVSTDEQFIAIYLLPALQLVGTLCPTSGGFGLVAVFPLWVCCWLASCITRMVH